MLPNHYYQDLWVKGECIRRGVRDCETRYEIIRNFCKQYTRPFTVIDLGANMSYFGIRLTEDFDCTVVSIETGYSHLSKSILERNESKRVLLLDQRLTAKSIPLLAMADHYDVILSFAIIHWIPMKMDAAFYALETLGDHMITELPYESTAKSNQKFEAFDHKPFTDLQYIGRVRSDIAVGFRKIYYSHKPKTTLRYSFPTPTPSIPKDLKINSSFESKELIKNGETSNWTRGINFYSFCYFNGIYPDWKTVREMLAELDFKDHPDLRPWNIVFSGDGMTVIDRLPFKNRKVNWKKARETLISCSSPKDLVEIFDPRKSDAQL